MGIPQDLQDFLSPGTNRLLFLKEKLALGGVESSIINIQDKKHLYVNFPLSSFNPQFKIKTIITHYDIVPNSPGANDNSACCLALVDFAIKILKRAKDGKISNIRIIFTDGEELGTNGVSSQGSFALAELFKKCGLQNTDVYVFDSCGRGNVPILARTGIDILSKNKNSQFSKDFAKLYTRTMELLKNVSPNSWMTLPVSYSDNAGFLACGLPAVLITFLPKNEADFYYKNLMSDKNLEKAVMNSKLGEDADFKFKYLEKMPMTWRLFHTEYDNLLSLTPESFDLLEKIFNELLIPYF